MNKNIQFLRDFLSHDRWRIAQLREVIYDAMEKLGDFLRHREPFVYLSYRDEDDPIYELAQLLDGNNFLIEKAPDRFGMHYLKLIPIYPETIEVECTYEVQEVPQTTYNEYYDLSDYACKCVLESIRNESRRILRAYHTLITTERYDEVDQPP